MIHLQQCCFQVPIFHKTRTHFTQSSGLTPLTLKHESIVADLASLFFASFTLIALLNHLTKLAVAQSTYRTKEDDQRTRNCLCTCWTALAQLQRGLLHRHSSGRTEKRHENRTDASTCPDRARNGHLLEASQKYHTVALLFDHYFDT